MKKTRSCEELGVCQYHDGYVAECHVECSPPPRAQRYPFAPGVIDGLPRSRLGVLEPIARALLVAACAGALVAVAGFCLGYLDLPTRWLP